MRRPQEVQVLPSLICADKRWDEEVIQASLHVLYFVPYKNQAHLMLWAVQGIVSHF